MAKRERVYNGFCDDITEVLSIKDHDNGGCQIIEKI